MKRLIGFCVCMSSLFLTACDAYPGAEPVYWGRSKESSMSVAISRNDIALVKKLLDEGFPPNAVIEMKYGEQPLHTAAYYGRYQIAEMLLARGAAVNALMTGGNARTPLLNAIWKKHNDVAILLLINGADPTIKTMAGATTCEFAKRIGNMDILPHLPNCKQ